MTLLYDHWAISGLSFSSLFCSWLKLIMNSQYQLMQLIKKSTVYTRMKLNTVLNEMCSCASTNLSITINNYCFNGTKFVNLRNSVGNVRTTGLLTLMEVNVRQLVGIRAVSWTFSRQPCFVSCVIMPGDSFSSAQFRIVTFTETTPNFRYAPFGINSNKWKRVAFYLDTLFTFAHL